MAVLILISGQAGAVARGMSGAAGMAEFCIGASPVMVYVDDKGQPTAPPHLCPDWAVSLLDHQGDSPLILLRRQVAMATEILPAARIAPALALGHVLPRGPPTRT